MGGFINALAQTSARVDWDELVPQHSVIPSSILTQLSKVAKLSGWAVSALLFRSDVLEDDESTITVPAWPCLPLHLALSMLCHHRTSVHFSRAGPQKTGKAALKRLLAHPPIPEAAAPYML